MKLLKVLSLSLSLTLMNFSSVHHNIDLSTTIVVVDGKALLVDVDESGKILTTYMEVAEYFTSNKDHKTKVIEAKAHYTKMSKDQMDQIRFIALAEEGWGLDEFMVSNLTDLAAHYRQTYANQIIITAAVNKENNSIVKSNISRIKKLLMSYGVASHDVIVDYKIDLGEEPTRFIKVVSNFRSLAAE